MTSCATGQSVACSTSSPSTATSFPSSPPAYTTALAGRWLISLPEVPIPRRAPPGPVPGAIHEDFALRHAGGDAPAERGSPCRRGASGAALYCAYWGDPLEGGAAPYRPCHSPWRSTDHRVHRLLLDRGCRRLRPGAYLSGPAR